MLIDAPVQVSRDHKKKQNRFDNMLLHLYFSTSYPSIYSFYFGTYSIRTDFQQKISCIDFMPRIYPQYFAYLASSVIAANFLDKKLSLIDKMCVIQHKNRKFYPIL